MQPYQVPADTVMFSEEIKKSRFITYLSPAEGIATAKSFLQTIKIQHPTARHHCWAFVAGAPGDSQKLGFSDDGEPSGTAGKPILNQLIGSHLGEITAVVVRYYGGVLLGTGGLVKAYGNGVQQALKLLPVITKTPQMAYSLTCGYHQLAIVESVVQQAKGRIIDAQYYHNIQLVISLPILHAEESIKKLYNASRGTLMLEPSK